MRIALCTTRNQPEKLSVPGPRLAPMTTAAVEDLDGQGLADALVANHATLLTAEARELVLAAAWADLHPTQALAPRPVLPGMERPRRFGGHGTPEAGEFAAAELAVLTGRSLTSASTLIADALDLRHRHPQLWAGLQAGQVRAWQARKIAARTRATGLTLTQATYVDDCDDPLPRLAVVGAVPGPPRGPDHHRRPHRCRGPPHRGRARPVRHHRTVQRPRPEDPDRQSHRRGDHLPHRRHRPDRRDPAHPRRHHPRRRPPLQSPRTARPPPRSPHPPQFGG